MRGGAIPLLTWATLLVVLLAVNWIWTGDVIQVGSFAFAALVIYAGGGLLFVVAGRQALRRGPPSPGTDPEPVPQTSVAAVTVGLSIGCILFGVVWAHFLVYFGVGVLVLSLARLGVELRAQREGGRRLSGDRRR